jgi:hypothetical protein
MPETAPESQGETAPEQIEPVEQSLTDKLALAVPPRQVLLPMLIVFAVLMTMAMPVLGQANVNTSADSSTDIKDTLQDIGDFISLIVVGVAVPNGAYGFLQYMTAGSNVEQDEKGRERIRNTFIGLAGVAVIQGAVSVFNSTLDLSAS